VETIGKITQRSPVALANGFCKCLVDGTKVSPEQIGQNQAAGNGSKAAKDPPLRALRLFSGLNPAVQGQAMRHV
jgi:hypothetical protein